jgi:hypothetical protein
MDFDTDLSTLISRALVGRAPRDSFILISFFFCFRALAAWPYDSMDNFAKSQQKLLQLICNKTECESVSCVCVIQSVSLFMFSEKLYFNCNFAVVFFVRFVDASARLQRADNKNNEKREKYF